MSDKTLFHYVLRNMALLQELKAPVRTIGSDEKLTNLDKDVEVHDKVKELQYNLLQIRRLQKLAQEGVKSSKEGKHG